MMNAKVKTTMMSVVIAVASSGCQTDHMPPDAELFNCAPVFREEATVVSNTLGEGGFDTIHWQPTLILAEENNRIEVPFAGARMQSILDTNSVYTFTVLRREWPIVQRIQRNGRTIYRYTDDMKSF